MSEEAKILKPWGDYFTPGASSGVIRILEEALKKATSGEIVAVGIVMINPGGFTMTRAVKGSRGFGEILGGVAVLQDDLIRLWKDDR